MVQGHRPDTDEDLARTGLRRWDVTDPQLVPTPVLVQYAGFHEIKIFFIEKRGRFFNRNARPE
jgi:hypothetical protein